MKWSIFIKQYHSARAGHGAVMGMPLSQVEYDNKWSILNDDDNNDGHDNNLRGAGAGGGRCKVNYYCNQALIVGQNKIVIRPFHASRSLCLSSGSSAKAL